MEVSAEYIAAIPTGQLITELLDRCKPACFIGCKVEDKGRWVTFSDIKGEATSCYGLCQELAFSIQEQMIKHYTQDKD